jgi:hypothetical protein
MSVKGLAKSVNLPTITAQSAKMNEAEWQACIDPVPMLKMLRGSWDPRLQLEFAIACARRILDLLVDDRSRTAVTTAQRFVTGEAAEQDLRDARDAAREFCDNIIHEDETFAEMTQNQCDAADAAAWAAELDWDLMRVRVAFAAQPMTRKRRI